MRPHRIYWLEVSLSAQCSCFHIRGVCSSWEAQQQFRISVRVHFCIKASISQMLSCPGMPADFSVLLVTLVKLVRLREKSKSLTIVACCSFVCVRVCFLARLSVCLCVCSSVIDGKGELYTPLPLCVQCLLNAVVTCHRTPRWQTPLILDCVPGLHSRLLSLLSMQLILLSCDPLRALNVTLSTFSDLA